MTADEELVAYVDGELDEAAARAFEARLEADAALAAEVERHRALRDRLRAAFEPIMRAPPPERLVVAARSEPRNVTIPGWSWPQWSAMAACLVVGVLAGRGMIEKGPLQGGADGRLTARGTLARALDTQLAADQAGKPIQVGLSFRTAGGQYCRTFSIAPERLAGAACHEGERWVVKVATAQGSAREGDYRVASSAMPPAVLAAVDAMIAGEALDAEAEKAARAKDWK